MTLNDQEHMFWATADETQPKEVSRGVETLTNPDGINTPTMPVESLCQPKIVFN